jgi:hypothetical protein
MLQAVEQEGGIFSLPSNRATRNITKIIANDELGLLTIAWISWTSNQRPTAGIANCLLQRNLGSVFSIDFHIVSGYI